MHAPASRPTTRSLSSLLAAIAIALASASACSREPAQRSAGGTVLAGEVLEALEAPPYSYLLLKTDTGQAWAAVPIGPYSRGDRVRVLNAARVRGVEAPLLGRRFDEVTFGTVSH